MALFFRNGSEFTGTVQTDSKGPFATVKVPCSRCGGARRIECYKHVEGGICFKCNGSRFTGTRRDRLYTAEQISKLNASQDKRNAKKLAAQAVARQAEKAEADARREAFQAANADVLPWLASVATDDDGNPREGFLGDMLSRANKYAQWTDGQAAAVRSAMEKRIAETTRKAASRHVGSLGERLSLTVTVEREGSYWRKAFSGFGADEEVFITTMRDEGGNALVVKSPRFRQAVGSVLSIKGTVKDHVEFRGEAQTILQRVSAS